jgi:hypothetical protein
MWLRVLLCVFRVNLSTELIRRVSHISPSLSGTCNICFRKFFFNWCLFYLCWFFLSVRQVCEKITKAYCVYICEKGFVEEFVLPSSTLMTSRSTLNNSRSILNNFTSTNHQEILQIVARKKIQWLFPIVQFVSVKLRFVIYCLHVANSHFTKVVWMVVWLWRNNALIFSWF